MVQDSTSSGAIFTTKKVLMFELVNLVQNFLSI